jgi:hypothetical protein
VVVIIHHVTDCKVDGGMEKWRVFGVGTAVLVDGRIVRLMGRFYMTIPSYLTVFARAQQLYCSFFFSFFFFSINISIQTSLYKSQLILEVLKLITI